MPRPRGQRQLARSRLTRSRQAHSSVLRRRHLAGHAARRSRAASAPSMFWAEPLRVGEILQDLPPRGRMRTVSGGSAGLPCPMGGGDGGATRPARRFVDAIRRSRTCRAPGDAPVAPRDAARDRRDDRVRGDCGGAGFAGTGSRTCTVQEGAAPGRPRTRRADVAAVAVRGRGTDDRRWRVRAADPQVGSTVSVRGRPASCERRRRHPDRDDTPDLGR